MGEGGRQIKAADGRRQTEGDKTAVNTTSFVRKLVRACARDFAMVGSMCMHMHMTVTMRIRVDGRRADGEEKALDACTAASSARRRSTPAATWACSSAFD